MQRWRFLVIRDPKVKQTVGTLYKRAYDEQVAPRYRAGEPAPGMPTGSGCWSIASSPIAAIRTKFSLCQPPRPSPRERYSARNLGNTLSSPCQNTASVPRPIRNAGALSAAQNTTAKGSIMSETDRQPKDPTAVASGNGPDGYRWRRCDRCLISRFRGRPRSSISVT
jgi:hypothetical protein